MTISVADFLEVYPEFTGAPTTQVEARLSEAAARTNSVVMGTLTTQAIMLRAAILLWYSPDARPMRLQDKAQGPRWEQELRNLQRTATVGLRTTA